MESCYRHANHLYSIACLKIQINSVLEVINCVIVDKVTFCGISLQRQGNTVFTFVIPLWLSCFPVMKMIDQ